MWPFYASKVFLLSSFDPIFFAQKKPDCNFNHSSHLQRHWVILFECVWLWISDSFLSIAFILCIHQALLLCLNHHTLSCHMWCIHYHTISPPIVLWLVFLTHATKSNVEIPTVMFHLQRVSNYLIILFLDIDHYFTVFLSGLFDLNVLF